MSSLVVGLVDNFGKALFPEVSYFTLYAPMAIILAVKDSGLQHLFNDEELLHLAHRMSVDLRRDFSIVRRRRVVHRRNRK